MALTLRPARPRIPPGGWSIGGQRSLLSAHSDLSVLSAGSQLSVLSAGCLLSLASSGSILSIGSAGCVLSVGSVGSVLSVGSVGSVLGVRSAFGIGPQRPGDAGADVHPLAPARAVGLVLGALALTAAVLDR